MEEAEVTNFTGSPTILVDGRDPFDEPGRASGPVCRLVEQVEQGAAEVAFLGLPTTARLHGVSARELARDRLVAVVAPARVEYVTWSRAGRTPAATAVLAVLDIPATLDTE